MHDAVPFIAALAGVCRAICPTLSVRETTTELPSFKDVRKTVCSSQLRADFRASCREGTTRKSWTLPDTLHEEITEDEKQKMEQFLKQILDSDEDGLQASLESVRSSNKSLDDLREQLRRYSANCAAMVKKFDDEQAIRTENRKSRLRELEQEVAKYRSSIVWDSSSDDDELISTRAAAAPRSNKKVTRTASTSTTTDRRSVSTAASEASLSSSATSASYLSEPVTVRHNPQGRVHPSMRASSPPSRDYSTPIWPSEEPTMVQRFQY